MKAVVFDRYGGPEVLHVADVDEVHAGPGEIRIAVRAASVNPIDWKLRSGALAEAMPGDLPNVVGYDASGVVDEIGEESRA
jgi:NADPH:quinone reductase-like Zn-dependent oxidoreductase